MKNFFRGIFTIEVQIFGKQYYYLIIHSSRINMLFMKYKIGVGYRKELFKTFMGVSSISSWCYFHR